MRLPPSLPLLPLYPMRTAPRPGTERVLKCSSSCEEQTRTRRRRKRKGRRSKKKKKKKKGKKKKGKKKKGNKKKGK